MDNSHVRRGLHLGAEFNGARGYSDSMSALVDAYRNGRHKDNQPFFSVLAAQTEAIERLCENLQIVGFDDVSRSVADGRHTDAHTYRKNVVESISYHRENFDLLRPDCVVVAGVQAHEAFLTIILPAIKYEGLVIRAWNPSPQAHRGRTLDWVRAYKDAVLLGENHEQPGPGERWTFKHAPRQKRFELIRE